MVTASAGGSRGARVGAATEAAARPEAPSCSPEQDADPRSGAEVDVRLDFVRHVRPERPADDAVPPLAEGLVEAVPYVRGQMGIDLALGDALLQRVAGYLRHEKEKEKEGESQRFACAPSLVADVAPPLRRHCRCPGSSVVVPAAP